jgi:hypothetical protein
MLDGKHGGKFLEIGAQDPIRISNTYLLETEFGWNGVSIDIDKSVEPLHKSHRNNTFICGNALALNYADILGKTKQIDYLQIDIDPAIKSYNCLKILLMEDYRFSVITFEHDAYAGGDGPYVRDASRKLFERYGYMMVAGNITNGTPDAAYEDWWVDPLVVGIPASPNKNANMSGKEFLSL